MSAIATHWARPNERCAHAMQRAPLAVAEPGGLNESETSMLLAVRTELCNRMPKLKLWLRLTLMQHGLMLAVLLAIAISRCTCSCHSPSVQLATPMLKAIRYDAAVRSVMHLAPAVTANLSPANTLQVEAIFMHNLLRNTFQFPR